MDSVVETDPIICAVFKPRRKVFFIIFLVNIKQKCDMQVCVFRLISYFMCYVQVYCIHAHDMILTLGTRCLRCMEIWRRLAFRRLREHSHVKT